MKTRVISCAVLAAVSGLLSSRSVSSAPPATNIDVLRPGTCIPGAKLYYAKDADDDEEVMAGIMQEKRKPDALIERYDAVTQTVYLKRTDGKSESLKLSDPHAEHWTVVYEGAKAAESTPVPIRANATSWQTSWDSFLTLAEQELNRLPPNAVAPWDGKEVTWQGTMEDMEIMMAKNLVRIVFAMPERALTIKGKPILANRMMLFIPMNYENFAPTDKGAKVRFKTTIAPIDATHPSVAAMLGKEGGKGVLVITTKGGSILK